MAIHVRVLGCFRLRVDGRRIDISPVPARILALLAIHGCEVRRSTVAGLLWPDVPHERALGNLRSALWRLPPETRSAVAECGASIRLADHVLCDLGRLRPGVPATCVDVPDVLALAWCDELLAGWYDDWVLDAREALQVRRAVWLEELSATSGASGRTGDALMFATLAVGVQPLRESAQRALLRAHLDVGHRQEAVTLYGEFSRMMLLELGVEPSPETAALVAHLHEEVA